ncbi:MAG: nucleoside-diphosphate kinase [Lentisphaeria bacterium]|nr:nucleoside-diphosphate kinase [Lentisphaeria bacterium]
MAESTSCLIFTPRMMKKGAAGLLLSRALSRSGLELAGARILALTAAEADELAGFFPCGCGRLADYIRQEFAPAADGRGRTAMLLLLSGENAVERTADAAGGCFNDPTSLRGTFGDRIVDADGETLFFEPAVLAPADAGTATAMAAFFARICAGRPNVVENADGKADGDEQTLVMIKPENWRVSSSRPGAILELLNRAGLRLIGCKLNRMSINDALTFYGPVQQALRNKLAPKIAAGAREKLAAAFELDLPESADALLKDAVGNAFADDQFFRIIEFMAGRRPDRCPESEWDTPNQAKALVLIFEGKDAVNRIRTVLGPTDPAKAPGGTVRGDFGSDVMVNAAHASDAPENYIREAGIVRIAENPLDELLAQAAR